MTPAAVLIGACIVALATVIGLGLAAFGDRWAGQ